MTNPVFWLGLSILLVAISLTALLTVAIPAFQELRRAARSAEKLFDTLHRELPPTLEALRLTGLEITELKEDVSHGMQHAGHLVQQVDQSIHGVRQQVQGAQTRTRSAMAGMKAAWRSLTGSAPATAKSRHPGRSTQMARRSSRPSHPISPPPMAPPSPDRAYGNLNHSPPSRAEDPIQYPTTYPPQFPESTPPPDREMQAPEID